MTASPFSLTIRAMQGRAYVPMLRRRLKAAHELSQSPLAELSLALVGDSTMSQLHQEFMNLPGPTDVLTFPLESDQAGVVRGGEVVVCVPEARRRAKEEGVAVEDELLLYALHGMLHLGGYDDRTDRDYRRMHRTEDRILVQLGVGPVFRPARACAPPPQRSSRARGNR